MYRIRIDQSSHGDRYHGHGCGPDLAPDDMEPHGRLAGITFGRISFVEDHENSICHARGETTTL